MKNQNIKFIKFYGWFLYLSIDQIKEKTISISIIKNNFCDNLELQIAHQIIYQLINFKPNQIRSLIQNLMNPQSINEVKSLVGKIDTKAMGVKSSRQKVKRQTVKNKSTYLQPNYRKQSPSIQMMGGKILQERFDSTIRYQPRTQESKAVYENYLGRIYELVQDQPQQTLISIADEILSCLKSDQTDDQKKLVMQQIIGQKIDSQKFLDLCNVVRNIKDYETQQYSQYNETIVMEEEENEGEQEEEKYAEEVIEEQDEEKGVDSIEIKQIKKEESSIENHSEIPSSQINAHWLQSKLAQYYDGSEVLKMEREVMEILQKKTKLQVENGLLSLLDYEKYDLIKLLLLNKQKVYYLTKYHQSSNSKQKEALKQEMRLRNIFVDIRQSNKSPKLETTPEDLLSNHLIEEDENLSIRFREAKEQDLARLPKKKIDLTYHDTTDYISKRQQYKFKLPDGAQKFQKPGYEEIIVPARKNQIKTDLIEVSTLPSWMQSVFTGIKRFNPIQSKVLDHTLNTNENMLVCAPTSAGKTNIALLSVLEVISNYIREDFSIDLKAFKIVYIAPMKALVSQITGNLSNKLKSLNITVKELTGDMHLTKSQIQQTQVIVSTPEKWDIITRKAGERTFTEKVKLLIIDEIHLLSDSRGPVLESLIARTIRQVQNTSEQVRIVGLSATLPNYKDVGLTLRVNPKRGLFYFDQSYRPIPLEQVYIGITEKKGVRKMMMINEILYEKVIQRVSSQQIIIFVHSRRDTVRTAKALRETAFTRDQLNKIIKPDSESKKILEAIASEQTISSKDLKQLLADGIGIHHAGLSRPDRDLVEELFADRHLNVLVSTATLAWGVNLPAHTVIIKGTQVYSPEQGRWVEISLQDIMQMLGRAGRPHFDTEGEGMIITGYEEIRYYLGLLNLQIPLQSQMLKSLPDQLNAEIVLGTVNNLKDAVNWLSYTYLYIRMLKNPKHYSIPLEELEEDSELLKRRVNLIHTAASILQNNGLIHYDKKNGTFSSTFLGKISSHYYIKHSSMTIYNSNLKNNSGLIELFKIFAMSSEFEFLVVRQEEKNQLKKLIETVPVPIKGSLEESSTKICALLQAYISRLPLEGYALNVDKVYVTQSASRIMRGLFQICLKRGWGQAAIKTLELSKMIDKSMWNCLNPLRQFKQIPEYVLSRLEKKEQFSWESFYQMNPQEIGDLTKFPKLGKILHKFVHHVPRVELDAYAQPLTRSSLKIELTVKGEFKWQSEYHGKEEGFWLFVLDCNQENILFSYYFVLRKEEMDFSMEFVVPLFQIMHPLYFIKVVSDRWITSNSSLPLSFRNILLPQKFSPPTQILDLQPLPASQLPAFAKSLKINYLNQIQTQVYQSILSNQNNVFIGASEGSGKFTLALFAMNQALNKGKKSILIEPVEDIAKSKFFSLSKIFSHHKVGKTFNDLTKDTQVLLLNDIIVATPEAWEVVSRRWKARKGFEKIGLFVVDGLHMLGEEKGETLEIIVSRMRSIAELNENQKIRIIATSNSVADYKELSEWIGAPSENTFNFHPSVRPNNFELIFSSHDQSIRESRTHIMQKNLFQIVKHYNRNNIIITNSKKQAKLSAIDFVTLLESESNSKRFLKISEEQFRSLQKKLSDKFLLHVLGYGIGYLYQGMNVVEKQIVEKLFQIEGINILFVDEGLKWELQNLKAFIVAVLDSQKYCCRKKRWVDYSICQMTRFMGMSRLSEKDKQKGAQFSSSKLIILCEGAKKNYYKKFLFEPYPLESSLHLKLADALNSAIVAKTVLTKEECIDWLSWTFFYRRIVQNPNYYNLQEVTEQSISAYLSELIQNSVEYLEKINCIEIQETEEKNTLSGTNLGIICSYYGIKVETLAAFVAGLNQNIKIKPLIQLICQAAELSHISYRLKQYDQINQLLVAHSETAKSKPEALLLLYFFRSKLPEEFTSEIREILPIVLKLIHSLVDIISSLGYLKPIILTMQLCQMLIQGMWITDSTLLQIMDKKIAQQIQSKTGIKAITDFMNMEDEERQILLKGQNIEEIATACNRYPLINLSTEIVQIDKEEVRLQVKLERDEELENLTVLSRTYHQEKEELWWVVVGQKKSNKVLTTKRIAVKGKSSIVLEFQKINQADQYIIYALCDSYIGCDQCQQINIESNTD